MRRARGAAAAAAVLAGWCAAAAPALAEEPGTTIDADGSYAVGIDITPGSYQSAGPVDDGACYWKRTAGDELLDNALTKKPAYVEILPTDTTFTTSQCQAWQLTDAPPPPQPGPVDLLGQLTGLIGSGMLNGGPR